MKIRYKTLKTALLLSIVTCVISSCQDWLTITPTTQIVEEDFWEDKSDLEGVRYAAYQQMCSTVEKFILWGDLRADTYIVNRNDGDKDTYALYDDIYEARMERDSANAYFDWSGVYRTINYCNKVLQHGPEVLQRDKQFTTTEWLQIKSEVTALRALNYFYLIRAFKDVPYTTRVVNNDTEVAPFGATDQLVILDSLIAELEEDPSIINQARRRFDITRDADTKTLITKPAILAMLSDMYLWRASLHQGRWGLESSDNVTITNVPSALGRVITHTVRNDYQKCIDYGRQALKELREQNTGGNASYITPDYFETPLQNTENIYLYKNTFKDFATSGKAEVTAFSKIFRGYSDETFFELPFSVSEKREHGLCKTANSAIWGSSSKTHLFIRNEALSDLYVGVKRELDSRLWFSACNKLYKGQGEPNDEPTNPYCFKWSGGTCGLKFVGSGKYLCEEVAVTIGGSTSCNVIIYRISDIMLQMAEAMAVLGKTTFDPTNGNFEHPLAYVNTIHRRWHCPDENNTVDPEKLDTKGLNLYYDNANENETMGNITSATNYEIAVFNERQLEFIGEGKRWFDLVRYAERYAGGADGTADPVDPTIGSGKSGVEKMTNDLMHGLSDSDKRGLYSRMQNRWGLYNLIYYKEIQASHGLLQQNPVWNKSKYEK